MATTVGADTTPASRTSAFAVVASVLIAPIALVFALRGTRFDYLFESVTFHLWVVSGIAACALVVAVVAARHAVASPRAHVQPLAVGCLAVGALMLAHGLVTPGILGRPANVWVARLPVLALTAFAVALWLVHRRSADRVDRPRATRRLVLAAGAIGLPLVLVVVDPTALGGAARFPGEEVLTDLVALGGGALLLQAGTVHWRRWRLSGSPLQRALTLAAWLATAAFVSLRLGSMWHLSWWDYHAFLLAGFGAAVLAIVQSRRDARPVDELLDSAFDGDPFAHIVSGYPEALRALVAAVEAKDHYTHGHSARVAELSVRLGLRIGLAPESLRALARGAYLHDVGKIAIPDAVLNKPGRLDDAERAWIETHPATGADMVRGTPSLAETVAVIRHHHERIDGGGYPDGLSGADIPLVARVCAVADVWDALTSDRAYRAAMTPEQALGIVLAARGTHLDARVVRALCEHLAEQGIAAADADGDPDLVNAAAEACHHDHDHVAAGTATGPAVVWRRLTGGEE